MVMVAQWLFEFEWVLVVWVCPEISPLGPKTTVLLASLGRLVLSCTFEIEVFYNLGQKGGGRKSILNQIFPWGVEGIYCPCLRVRDRRDIERKLCDHVGCEEFHLGTFP